ncbi:MAG TPA: hypothetical protein PLJ19_01230 [Dysgonamonadaceae bacterium]|jgi:uncharacterized protein (UPF0218 family)|nr:hypothetical protein [Dysgonamonadaceae bacterium]
MRAEISNKIEKFVDKFYAEFAQHDNRITICTVGSAQYINYLLEKGIISNSEVYDLKKKAIDTIELHYELEIPFFLKNGLIEIMDNVKSYDYEIISKFIK